MSRSLVGHISKRSLHTILAIFVGLVVVFFAVTRTQVGRDALARQLETQFNQSTGGSLTVGSLTGNIRQDLFASDVEIRSPQGNLIASIDSVVVRPKWTSLLQKEFSVHEIRLIRPILDLADMSRDSSTASSPFWNRLRQDPADSTQLRDPTEGWQFRNATLRIEDGAIRNLPSIPEVALSDLELIGLRSILSWDEDGGQIDLLDLQATMPDQRLAVRQANAQAVFNDDTWSLNQARIETENSSWRIRGSIAADDSESSWLDRAFQFEIEPSNVDFDELSRVIPDLPLRDRATLSSYVSGPVSTLTIPWIRVERGESSIAASGTAVGYPDSVQVEFSLSEVQLHPVDLRALLPTNRRVRDLQAEISDFQFYSSGTVYLDESQGPGLWSAFVDTRSTFDLRSSAGMVSGTLALSGSPADSMSHRITARLEDVNGYPWTSRARWTSSLGGYVTLEGFVRDSSYFASDLSALLTDVQWSNRRADSLRVNVDLTSTSMSGDVSIHSGVGHLDNQFSLTRGAAGQFRVQSESVARNLDVGPIMGNPHVHSSINAQVSGRARLKWDRTFSAEVAAVVDSSRLQTSGGIAEVPPHSFQATVSPPGSNRPVVDFTSDMFDLQVDSQLSLPTIVALSRAWATAVNASIDQESRKLLNDSAEEALDPEATLSEWLTADAAQERFPDGLTSATSSINATLHSGALVSALSPAFPDLEGAADLQMNVIWSADSLRTTINGSSQRFRYAGISMVSPSLETTLSLARGSSVLGTMTSTMAANSDTLTTGGTAFSSNQMEWDIENGQGSIRLSSAGTDRLDAMQLEAGWERRDSVNVVQLSNLEVDTGDGAWVLDRLATFGFYGNATTLDNMRVVFEREGVPTSQSVFAGGTFSASVNDSLRVAFSELELQPLSEFMEWRRTLGGLLNADLVVRGGYQQPTVTGFLAVDTLSLDHYILGNASLRSNYVASRPEVAVDLRLEPIAPDDRAVLYGTDTPATILQNQLQVAGDVRFPGQADEDSGMLNLETTIDQADVFWMMYIFPEVLGSVSGFLSGEGRISGTFAYPVFDVRLGVVDGLFNIPYTQTTYAASGTLRMDEEAIHFDPLRLVDQTGGRLEVDGKLLFNEYTSFTFDMEGRFDEFQIMNVGESEQLPFYGFLWASGNARLTGPLFNARLVSTNGRTTDNSELFIPIEEETRETDQAFIVFEDTPGVIPDFRQLESRSSILQRRPSSERQFLDGLNLDLNIDAPQGSIVHLVIDPLLGDVINAVSTGNVQLILENDEFQVFGRLDVTSGDYQFTAGELFIKTFQINPGGFIEWSGDPINATLNIPASYRTRASRAGLPGTEGERPGVIPLIVDLQIGGTVDSPEVELSLSIDRSNQNVLGEYQALEALLNQPDRATEYATSVLILNSFQLTTESITTDSGGQLAFNSVSQLVTAQLNRFLESALPNVDFSLGFQGESAQDLDVTYGVALRLLNERLIIRGEGVYQGARSTESVRTSDGLQGEFVVEIRVGPRVSVEVFFRRESDILESTQLTNTAGVGLSYQTEFESWRSIIRSENQNPLR